MFSKSFVIPNLSVMFPSSLIQMSKYGALSPKILGDGDKRFLVLSTKEIASKICEIYFKNNKSKKAFPIIPGFPFPMGTHRNFFFAGNLLDY